MPHIQEGDILLYFRNGGLAEVLVDTGERMEDGEQDREYYHCAIALNSQLRIEADGFEPVTSKLIVNDGSFEVFRPPISLDRVRQGLQAVRALEGQKYDWLLILDDGLRYLTHNRIHLPEKFIKNQERRRKICSTLVAFYFEKAGWGHLKQWPRPSPEDIWLRVMDYPVEVYA